MAPNNRVTPEDIAVFNDSLYRCLRDEGFLDRFYELFLSSSPEVQAKFDGTDFERQKRALRQSLYAMYMAVEGEWAATLHLERVADYHGRGELDIRPELYDLWLASLIRAVIEHDPELDDEIERIWRDMMAFGIEVMRARY